MHATESPKRRHDLDSLKIFATLLLIPYHSAVIFAPNFNYYIHNDTNCVLTEFFIKIVNLWFMLLFFFVAGVAAKYSLNNRSKKQYCLERLYRLCIPLLFSIFALIPIIGYFAFIHHHDIKLSFLQYYPVFFNIDYKHIDGFTGTFTPGHLWFILYLFCFSLITLPLFDYLKSKGEYFVAKLVDYSSSQPKVVIFICVILLGLCRMITLVYYNPVYYLMFFMLGYLFLLDKQFETLVEENNSIALLVALAGTLFYLYSGVNEYDLAFGKFNFTNILIHITLGLSSFCWLIVLLNLARRYLNWSNSLIAYLNEASYPIYIIHMTFLAPIAFYTVQWNVGILIKFLFITFASFFSIIIVYHIFIKRFKVTRFLLGMKINS